MAHDMKTSHSPEDLIATVRALLAGAQNLAAMEYARAAVQNNPQQHELLYLHALACARCGALAIAHGSIASLRQVANLGTALHADVESLAGRLAKDAWTLAEDDAGRVAALDAAIASYLRADSLHPNLHARINAASMLRLAGRDAEAATLAQQVLSALDQQPQAPDHWDWATRGEAALLSGDLAQAFDAYGRAHQRAGARHGDVASMRRQLQLLAPVLPDAQQALAMVPGSRVIAFSGHMIDTDDRAVARFPAALEEPVREAIERHVAASLPAIGYSQAACGSDILFCECMLKLGQEYNIVLPFERRDFLTYSVLPGGASWATRFERVLAGARSVTVAAQSRYFGDDALFEHASDLMLGLCLLRAQQLAVKSTALLVADETQAGLTGGTLATRDLWGRHGLELHTIDLTALRAGHGPQATAGVVNEARTRPQSPVLAGGKRSIKSLLFADVKGFGHLAEEHFPAFFQRFRGLVPGTIVSTRIEPLECSSSGDGLYAVFATPQDAAGFAMALSTALGSTDWLAMGLPADTHIRIALHTGPVFSGIDPMTGRLAFYGAEVTRTARVEPVVIPGQVLVTEPFAAVLAAQANGAFACDLVGTQALAKDHGTARLYRLRAKQAQATARKDVPNSDSISCRS